MSQPIPCEYISWNRFYDLCRRLVSKVRQAGFQPDVIVAIGRGGYMPARIVSDFLGLMNLTSFKMEHYRGAHKEPIATVRYPLAADVTGQRVLLVDDVSDTGDTFRVALEHIRERSTPAEVRTAALHHKVVSHVVPDFYARKMVKWRWIIYPWAVVEDLSAFLESMEPRPRSVEEFAERLARDYQVRMPRRMLLDVLTATQS